MIFVVCGKYETAHAADFSFKLVLGTNDEVYQPIKSSPLMIHHTAYMPLEDFIKATNLVLHKNERTQKANITDGQAIIHLNIKENTYTIGNTKTGNLIKKQDLIFVPIRSFAEFFGLRVFYLSDQKVVRIVNGNHQLSNPAFIHKNKKIIQSYFSRKQKKIYLTFDDGPRDISSQIVNVLKEKQAKATFFMLEPNMKKYPELVKRIIQEGHYIGLHSVTHNKEKLYSRPEHVIEEMEQTRKTLYSITQFDSKLVRVPYGSKPYMTTPYRNELVQNHFKMWDWHIDTLDWKYHSNKPEEIVQAVKNGIAKYRTRNEIVILFHDVKGTAQVLPDIIDYLKRQGFELAAYNPDEHVSVNFWEDRRL
jgi:peptidoglycan/xylan/chitin deacetylase (PgdA/CDA1 family)